MTKKFLLLFALLPMLVFSQHSIKGTFSPAKDYQWAILYKVTPTTSVYVKNTTLDQEGKFEIKLDSTITKGIYRLVYALPQEEFNFDIIYDGKEDIVFTFHKTDGIEYTTSKENQIFNSYIKSMDLVNKTINNYYVEGKQDEKAFKSIFKTLKETQDNFEEASKGTIASNFIKANAPYIPTEVEDIKVYSKHLKDTYFKEVDFANPYLQSSNFLIERVLNYVFGMNADPEDVDGLNKAVDVVVSKMKGIDTQLQKTLLQILWQQLVDYSLEKTANYLADSYLLEISEKAEDSELKKQLMVVKNTAIGALAPDFSWEKEVKGKKKTISFSGLDKAEYYAVIFWSSTCSHCLEELPKIKKYIATLPEGKLKVIAIGLEEEPYRWNNETAYYPDFEHVYGEGKWDNPIGDAYGVSATPTFFVMDKTKKIINKPNDFSELKPFVDGLKMPKKENEKETSKKSLKKNMLKEDKSN